MSGRLYSKGKLTSEGRQKLYQRLHAIEANSSLEARAKRQHLKRLQGSNTEVRKNLVRKTRSVNDNVKLQERQKHMDPKDITDTTKPLPKTQASRTIERDQLIAQVKHDVLLERWGSHLRRQTSSEAKKSIIEKKALDWTSIVQFKQRMYEVDLKKKSAETERRKIDYKNILLGQISDREQAHQLWIQARDEEKKGDANRFAEFKKESERIELQRLQLIQKEKESRASQLEEIEKQKKQEKAEQFEKAARANEALKIQLEKEREQESKKKEEKRKTQRSIIVENDQRRARKVAEAKLESEQDRALQRVYDDVMDKREKEREIAHQKILDRQQDKPSPLTALVVIEKEKEKMKDEMIENEKKRLESEQSQRETTEASLRRRRNESMKEMLDLQVRERRAKESEERAENRQYRKQLDEFEDKYRLEEEVRIHTAREERKKRKIALQLQIEQLRQRRLGEKFALSDTERLLNRDLLQAIGCESQAELGRAVCPTIYNVGLL